MSGFLGWTPQHGLFPPREEGQESELMRFMQRLAGGAQDTLFREQMESITGESSQKNSSWSDIFTVFDAHEDIGIGAQRQIRGIDEGYGQGGIVDMVWQLMGDFVRGDSQTYQSPYGPDQSESAQMQGIEGAGLGERIASGLLVPGGGGVDAIQGLSAAGRAAFRHTDDLLGLAARSTDVDDIGRGFRAIAPEEAQRYVDAASSLPLERQAFLTPHTADSIREKIAAGGSVRMTDDGVGYIVDASGDLQGVINASGRPGAGRAAIEDALENGARTLDAYDGYLTELYSSYGFRETNRASWNPDYASPLWNAERYGNPDVVWMARDGMPTATDVERIAETISRMPEEHRGLVQMLANVVDSNNLGMAPNRLPLAARKVVNRYDDAGNVIGQAKQADLQTEWLQRTLDNLTPEQLDGWERSVRHGMQIEDSRRVLDMGDGTQVLLRHWYDTEPVMSGFTRALGDGDGKAAYAGLMSLIAATSPRTQVRENVETGIALAHHIAQGRRLRDIAAMSADEFSGAIIRGGGFHGSDVAVTPASALRHAEYKGSPTGPVPKRPSDELTGTVGQVLQGERMSGQKVSTFLPNTVDPVLGGSWTSLTIDSHNIRQTLHHSGVPIATGADRLALARAWGIEDLTDLKPFFEDVVVPAGKQRALSPDRIAGAFADTLYAKAITRTGLYSILEDYQRGVMKALAARSPDLDMAEALFQARVWTGSNDASVVADTVPLAQAVFDSLRDWGVRRMGGETNMDAIIRQVWGADDGTDVLLEAVRRSGNYASMGIHTVEDFRNLLVRGAAKATPRRDEQDMLGLLGLGGEEQGYQTGGGF